MKYEHITEGRFIDRPNRFIAHVEINGPVSYTHLDVYKRQDYKHSYSSD